MLRVGILLGCCRLGSFSIIPSRLLKEGRVWGSLFQQRYSSSLMPRGPIMRSRVCLTPLLTLNSTTSIGSPCSGYCPVYSSYQIDPKANTSLLSENGRNLSNSSAAGERESAISGAIQDTYPRGNSHEPESVPAYSSRGLMAMSNRIGLAFPLSRYMESVVRFWCTILRSCR